jgi:hypothetical protein
MADQNREGARKREGFGDDQGTRVGRPDEGTGEGRQTTERTGAGAEAAEGVHSAGGRDERENSGLTERDAGGATDNDRAGSEPLGGREREHRSGYGGQGGRPVQSSDTREPLEPKGKADPQHTRGPNSYGANEREQTETRRDARSPREQMEEDI